METLLKDLDVAEMEGFRAKKAVMQRNHTTTADITDFQVPVPASLRCGHATYEMYAALSLYSVW